MSASKQTKANAAQSQASLPASGLNESQWEALEASQHKADHAKAVGRGPKGKRPLEATHPHLFPPSLPEPLPTIHCATPPLPEVLTQDGGENEVEEAQDPLPTIIQTHDLTTDRDAIIIDFKNSGVPLIKKHRMDQLRVFIRNFVVECYLDIESFYEEEMKEEDHFLPAVVEL